MTAVLFGINAEKQLGARTKTVHSAVSGGLRDGS